MVGKPAPAPERFWRHVNKTDSCWLWAASTEAKGYGLFWDGKTTCRAHRYAYGLLRGPIPRGLQIDHLCRVRNCVNPAHLEVVNNRTNTLRGVGATAQNARKTHCKRGHPLEGDNLYLCRAGRRCRTCERMHKRRYKQRLKGADDDAS